MPRYEDSSEFTNDLDQMVDHLMKSLEILQKPEFRHWMQQTDQHYRTGASPFETAHLNLTNVVCLASLESSRFQTDIYNLDE